MSLFFFHDGKEPELGPCEKCYWTMRITEPLHIEGNDVVYSRAFGYECAHPHNAHVLATRDSREIDRAYAVQRVKHNNHIKLIT